MRARPQTPALVGAEMARLFEAGDFEAARGVADRLIARRPDSPTGPVWHARIAAAREDWKQAASLWEGLIDRFPDYLRDEWYAGLAAALVAQFLPGEAERVLREGIELFPDSTDILIALTTLLIETGQRDRTRDEMARGVLCPRTSFARLMQRLRVWVWLAERDEAEAAYEAAFDRAGSAEQLSDLFVLTAEVYEFWQRQDAWLRLQERLTRMRSRSAQATLLQVRLALALRDFPAVVRLAEKIGHLPERWQLRIRPIAERLADPGFPDLKREKIFGIGLSRTGTTSLHAALRLLGYSSAHYQCVLTQAMLTADDALLYDATTDTPVCYDFETLFATFPNAKFVLTTRPYEEWADAFTRYFRATIGGPELEGRWRGETIEASAERRRVHLALYWRHGSLRAAWDAYEKRVARFFADKPGRLLHFDIFAGDGWEKLCAFLGRDIPAAPFPWRNRGLTVAEDVRPA